MVSSYPPSRLPSLRYLNNPWFLFILLLPIQRPCVTFDGLFVTLFAPALPPNPNGSRVLSMLLYSRDIMTIRHVRWALL